jgi:hypothetical protein
MKFSLIISAIFASIIFSSCEKINELLTFNIEDEVTFTIENQFGINLPFEIPLPNIKTNATREFENQNTKADLVKNVSLEELKLTIISPTNKTFSFIKSIRLFVAAENIDEAEIAYEYEISSNAQTINLSPTGVKLDEYLKAGSYSLRTEVTLRETLTEDIQIKVNLNFKVTADPL